MAVVAEVFIDIAAYQSGHGYVRVFPADYMATKPRYFNVLGHISAPPS